MISLTTRSLLSPRELAEAIGVSESSVKRWADEGAIAVSRTAGGHRRIAVDEVIRFLRASRLRVVKPQLLGLAELALSMPAGNPTAEAGTRLGSQLERGDELLFELLRGGRAADVRAAVLAWYLDGHSVAQILDGPLRGAMEKVGELWQHSPSGIFYEHRASDIALQALNQLRGLLPHAAPSAPVAVGGAPQGDPYLLPSLGVATVLAAAGFAVANLGPQTPAEALREAVSSLAPRVAWLSVSSYEARDTVEREVPALLERLAPAGVLLVGGRAARGLALPEHARLFRPSSMIELEAYVRGLEAPRGDAKA